jgi:hypothetical protein
MQVAVALAPADRYILRSAARFAVHRHEVDRAHSLVARAGSTPTDPWLMATEIALSHVADRPSRLVRRGQQALESGRYAPFDTSELASALGTLEATSGNDRGARKLFRQALTAPNDNSIAQAEWARANVSGVSFDESLLERPTSWEARALVAGRAGNWINAVHEAWQWHFDQPFASRPAEFGSYHASAGQDFKSGVELARAGLVANPSEFLLRNNLAFCLASMDEVKAATAEFAEIDESKLAREQRSTYLATKGLIAFRSGDPDTGRRLYQQSIASWKHRENRLLATIMLVREELLAQAPEAPSLAEQVFTQMRGEDSDLQVWLGQLDSAAKGTRIRLTLPKRTIDPSESPLPKPRKQLDR